MHHVYQIEHSMKHREANTALPRGASSDMSFRQPWMEYHERKTPRALASHAAKYARPHLSHTIKHAAPTGIRGRLPPARTPVGRLSTRAPTGSLPNRPPSHTTKRIAQHPRWPARAKLPLPGYPAPIFRRAIWPFWPKQVQSRTKELGVLWEGLPATHSDGGRHPAGHPFA